MRRAERSVAACAPRSFRSGVEPASGRAFDPVEADRRALDRVVSMLDDARFRRLPLERISAEIDAARAVQTLASSQAARGDAWAAEALAGSAAELARWLGEQRRRREGEEVPPFEREWFESVGASVSIAGRRVDVFRHAHSGRAMGVDQWGDVYRYDSASHCFERWGDPVAGVRAALGQAVAYETWINLDAGCDRAFRPGDRLVRGWVDVCPGPAASRPDRLLEIADWVVRRHQDADRPDQYLAPPLAVGDVVLVGDQLGPDGESSVTLGPSGFELVTPTPDDRLTGRSWHEMTSRVGSPLVLADERADAQRNQS